MSFIESTTLRLLTGNDQFSCRDLNILLDSHKSRLDNSEHNSEIKTKHTILTEYSIAVDAMRKCKGENCNVETEIVNMYRCGLCENIDLLYCIDCVEKYMNSTSFCFLCNDCYDH